MIKPGTARRKRMLLIVALCVLLGLSLFTAGIAGRQFQKRDDIASQAENAGRNEDRRKEQGVVVLSQEKLRTSGIGTVKVTTEAASMPLTATGTIELNADRASRVSSRVTGRIIRITVSQGDRIKTGQPLAYIDTVELDQIWSEYKKHKGRHELALKNLKREEALFEKNVAPEKDVLRARQELSEVEADLIFSKERFRLLGIDVSSVEARKNGDDNMRPLIPILSPVGGVVIEKSVTLGEIVNSEKLLFTVADLSTLWVLVDTYEKDISRLKTGVSAHVAVNALPHKVFRGKIAYVGDVVDGRTRTVKTRVTIENEGGLLKPGMFSTVSIDSIADPRFDRIIAVPEEGVLIDGTARYVFIQIGEGTFKRRDVVLGRTLGKKVQVLEGLNENDPLVVKGLFALKSEYKKELLRVE